jgi:beta-galactosidase
MIRHRLFGLIAVTVFASILPARLGAQTRPAPAPDGKPHKIETRDKQFLIDGRPIELISGEMHFGRTLPEDFELRVKQARAMGLNTLSFYLFWNQVETQQGRFDFTGANDVRRMLKICQDNGMWAVLRPGPYCCAEVDYGGIPYWTLKHPEVKIRSNDPTYVQWSRDYINRVYKEVADFQITKGGPLLMVQIENEYAIVANDLTPKGNYDYMRALHQVFVDAGFDVPLFVCDPGSLSRPGADPYGGLLRGRNGLHTEADYQQAVAVAGDFPIFVPEVYTAWFTGWGQPIATKNASLDSIVSWTNFLLDHRCSFNYYLFFGGTNYGFSNGCNYSLPVITSYDYNAPIDEAGRVTEKYRTLRDLLSKRLGIQPPPIPDDPPVADLPAITFTMRQPLDDWLGDKAPVSADKPLSMEDLDQAYGFVDYRKTFPDGLTGRLELKQAMDYAITLVNGRTVGESFIGYGPKSNFIDINQTGRVTLDILVYNLGRISVVTDSGTQSLARKGLIGGAFLDGKELVDWDIRSLPMTSIESNRPVGAITLPQTGPTFYRATFNVTKPAGTFLDMSKWSFGVVWVNGHNLGRYWDRGGARSLFLPSHFLKAGANDIVILELHNAPAIRQVSGTTKIIDSAPVPFALKLDQPNPS